MALASALRLAVGTLTVVPAGAVTDLDRATARDAMLLAPLAVLPLAAGAGVLACAGAALGWPGLVVGLVTVAGLTLGTRALHLDGLADTVDGLGSGRDATRALEVMRRGDVGPMGAVALVLVVGLQAAAVGGLVHGWRSALVLAVLVCCSRAALAVVCRRGVPAARLTGLGAAVAGSVPLLGVVLTWVGVAAVLAALWPLRTGADPVAGEAGGVLTAGLALAACWLVVRWCSRRLGGVTGDVMGACVEVTLTVLLLGAAAAPGGPG